MKCNNCGITTSNTTNTVCPFCQPTAEGGAATMTASGVWPPAPTANPSSPPSDSSSMEATQLRQTGILMAVIPLVVVQAASFYRNVLPYPYGFVVWAVIILASLYPHFRGCAHWAESKGYPRYEGRVLGILGWLGVLFLAIRRDKYKAA